MSGPHSSEQITKAQAFAQKIQAGTYSPATQAKIAQATQYATFFDIETGGLDPKKHPIYEMGFQHGTGPNARFTHHFVNPGSAPIDPWSEAYMAKREAESNGNFRIALSQGLSQRDAAQQAYSELAGRDIWVQNLRHERTFLNTRTGKHGFNEWARNARLESFTDGAGLYPTTPGLKNYIAEASRQSFVGDTQSVLNAWEDVFTKGFAPALENRQAGVTRAFDIMDLTKSVFAMAQNRGHMAKTGELFTGTSVDTFSREMFGIEELHEALPDNVMQSSMVERFLGAGYAMQNGEALDPQTAGFFKRLGEAIPQIKHHNTVKGIARTFADQQEFLATVAEGKPNYELLKGARTTFDNVGVQLGLNVIQPDGSYAKENTEFYLREKQNPRLAGGVNTEHYSTDIGEVVRARKARDAKLPGVKANWDAAYEQATQNYIRPYQEALATNRGAGMSESEAIRAALKSVEEHAVKLENAPKASLEAILKEAPSSTKASNFLKRNWKVGLGIFGAVIAANYISSKDDDYNYLEGLRHGGIAGETRKHNTDFGSGYQGMKMMLQDVMQEVTEYSSRQSALEGIRRRQEEREQNKRGRTLEGLNGGFDGPIADMEIDDYSVEDADTISIQMANGNQIQMRLAGIDAPEISHENDDGSRIWQDQPYGQQAKSNLQALLASQKNLTAVIDPLASQSYGRTVGMIYGDNGQNINLELVRQGSAAALPFGKAREQIAGKKEFMQAESDAAAAQQGMWDYESWQISRQLQEDSKRRITNTSYTDLGRLFSNFKTSSILMRMRNPDSEMADMEAAGGKDDFNIIEGMKHGWVGASRKMNTDFGSGYQVLDGIIPSLSSTARTTRKLRQSHMLSTTRMRMNMKRSNLVKHHIG